MKILSLKKVSQKEIKREVVSFLKKEKVVLFPTDTLYALLANVFSKKAIDKVYKIKKRKIKKPLPIFVKNIEMAKKVAEISPEQENFLKNFWPGRITVILKKKKNLKIYGTEKESIGLRVPKYPLLNEILKEINFPLSGTSANLSGKKPKNFKEILNQFEKEKPDLAVFGGEIFGKPSLILDLREKHPSILRF